MKTLKLALALTALASVACTEEVESTDIRTTGIYPEIVVTATGNGSSLVQVWLKVGGARSNTYLDLKGDDTLIATVDGESKALDGGPGHVYRASFPVDAEGTEFEVGFLRGEADDDAPSSKVRLPAPFDLVVDTTEASRAADEVSFSWDPPGSGSVSWQAKGSCIITESASTPDDGTGSIPSGEIRTFESDKEKSCTVDFELTRERAGQVDPAFTEGGRVVARQVRSSSFTSTP